MTTQNWRDEKVEAKEMAQEFISAMKDENGRAFGEYVRLFYMMSKEEKIEEIKTYKNAFDWFVEVENDNEKILLEVDGLLK